MWYSLCYETFSDAEGIYLRIFDSHNLLGIYVLVVFMWPNDGLVAIPIQLKLFSAKLSQFNIFLAKVMWNC